MIRAILDANVYVSAAITRTPDSAAARVLDAVVDGRIEALQCPTLLGELTDTLHRPKLKRYLSDEQSTAFVADVALNTRAVADPSKPYAATSRDPKDDYLLALLDEHPDAVLCTGDGDLLELRHSHPIVTPRELISRLDAEH